MATYAQWLQRQEAMSRLLEHPTAAPHAVAACIALASDRSSPVFIEPMALLEVTARQDATGYILRQIARPEHDRALHGALLASIHKVDQKHFDQIQALQLAAHIADHLRDLSLAHTLKPIAAEVGRRLLPHLPDTPRLRHALQRCVGIHQGNNTHHSNDLTTQDASRRLARQATQHLDRPERDETLELLVHRALFSADPDHRMLASMLIAATPIQRPTAATIVHAYTKDLATRTQIFPLTTLRTVTNLGVDIHRPLIHHILTGPGFPPPVAHAAAWATPHCPGADTEATWRKSLTTQIIAWNRNRTDLGDSILHGLTYGIGTDGHHRLLTQISNDPQLPHDAHNTASWLLKAKR